VLLRRPGGAGRHGDQRLSLRGRQPAADLSILLLTRSSPMQQLMQQFMQQLMLTNADHHRR